MKTKDKDVLYCGVNSSKIEEALPVLNEVNVSHLFDWVEERYKIFYKKSYLEEPAPWTKNPVLRDYRFTNVKRYHDKESIWLIENIAKNSDLTLEEKIYNCILFRSWNRSDTFTELGGPFKVEDMKLGAEHFRSLTEKLIADQPNRVWYTPAFNTGGAKSAWAFPGKYFLYLGANSNKTRVKLRKKRSV